MKTVKRNYTITLARGGERSPRMKCACNNSTSSRRRSPTPNMRRSSKRSPSVGSRWRSALIALGSA